MNIDITEIAQNEFFDAKEFYELESSGLGEKFHKEIKASLLRIQKYPDAWPFERKEIRKCILIKFPYKILYSIQDKKIIILAFAHHHRDPDYWIDRL